MGLESRPFPERSNPKQELGLDAATLNGPVVITSKQCSAIHERTSPSTRPPPQSNPPQVDPQRHQAQVEPLSSPPQQLRQCPLAAPPILLHPDHPPKPTPPI